MKNFNLKVSPFSFSFIFFLFFLGLPHIIFAKELTVPFGGRVLSTKLPGVSCLNPTGTAPVVLSSNLAGVVQVGVSSADRNQNTGQRIGGAVGGLYRAIPLYTWAFSPTGTVRQPKAGDWILGRQKLVPNLSTCVIDGANVPFPVVETNNYSVSQKIQNN